MEAPELLASARAAHDARAWMTACDAYAQLPDLDSDDLDRYAVAAHLSGRIEQYFVIREREYRLHLERGEILGAARAAGWIGTQRMVMGQVGPGSGWLARAARHVDEVGEDCAERGYLLLAETFGAMGSGDLDGAATLAREAVAYGRRYAETDLVVLAMHQLGLVLLAAGRVPEGLGALDEAMVSVVAGEVSPMVTGIVFCGVIQGCWGVFEIRRAHEWTAAMTLWCDAQPQLGNFTGECKVRRAELRQLHGEWSDAHEDLAGVRHADVDRWAAAAAAYVRGNLDRLQGRFEPAEAEFGVSARLGLEPQPGLALLRLAQGSAQAAAAMVRRALTEVHEPGRRVELLVAAAEVLVAVDETAAAQEAAAELAVLAESQGSQVMQALAAQAMAEVDLHRGRPDRVLVPVRTAMRTWLLIGAPYQEARARTLLARACRALGDEESADRELDTARLMFEDLGALTDLQRIGAAKPAGLLTPRELEVLRLVATGTTNRAIADQLVVSERTVDRHVSNIFAKLGVTSRSAATAYAYQEQLV